MINLGALSETSPHSHTAAANDHGQVVGVSVTDSGVEHAFLWQDGVMLDLGALAGGFSRPYAINARGVVVGESLTEFSPNGVLRAVLWTQ